ncbi:unnamed protein product (macronuclear) [Paramecium tetraurelia]|uniref:Uncharacterized protein n=1 Tax=Paramecium tetraurelia TaxID=5888 RepID=A0C110_PARTE|nr:uncharacterized protein GSPATT00033953001 [Paramecium tetraurelia]CAK64477.1 unnamed protein product [Paramecium tetraurelia]|eukprot:XP_001431875.1 hypothetical protein (macronuclear) [Paramecium tetraurelia strain d4-2]
MSNLSQQQQSSLPVIKNKLHVGENLMYQIHKRALQEYLKSGNIDQRIVSMNLLNVSQLKNEELNVLHQSLSTKNQKLEGDAGKILSKFRPKVKSNGLPLYFKKPDYSHEDQELNQLEEHLKIVLKSKLNTCKVFNGTYLVDPSIQDLQRTNQKSKPHQQFVYFPAIKRQPSQGNLRDTQQIKQVVNQRLHDSQLTLQELRERYKESKLSDFQKGMSANCNLYSNKRKYPKTSLIVQIIKVTTLFTWLSDKRILNYQTDLSVLTRKKKSIKQLLEIYYNDDIYELINGKKKGKLQL